MAKAMKKTRTRFARWYSAFRESRYYSRFEWIIAVLPSQPWGLSGPGTPSGAVAFAGALYPTN
jgi:hypothetical protein